jgi:hypothetical protein
VRTPHFAKTASRIAASRREVVANSVMSAWLVVSPVEKLAAMDVAVVATAA